MDSSHFARCPWSAGSARSAGLGLCGLCRSPRFAGYVRSARSAPIVATYSTLGSLIGCACLRVVCVYVCALTSSKPDHRHGRVFGAHWLCVTARGVCVYVCA